MKTFSILNKPAKANEQAGLVFLEYVIMAFIATVAVICALWWFYWHLQQMTWEIKQKLETLKTLTCPLEPPYGAAPGEQPTPPGPPGESFRLPEEGTITDADDHYIENIVYPNQTLTIHNVGSVGFSGNYDYIVSFYDNEGNFELLFGPPNTPPIPAGGSYAFSKSWTTSGPYEVAFAVTTSGAEYYVTLETLP